MTCLDTNLFSSNVWTRCGSHLGLYGLQCWETILSSFIISPLCFLCPAHFPRLTFRCFFFSPRFFFFFCLFASLFSVWLNSSFLLPYLKMFKSPVSLFFKGPLLKKNSHLFLFSWMKYLFLPLQGH